MEEEIKPRRHFYLRYLLSLGITIVVFLLIFSIANSVSYLNYQKISTQNNIIQFSIEELEYNLRNLNCENKNPLLYESSRRLDEVGSKLNLLEKRFGKQDQRVIEQKNLYNELELKHLDIINSLNFLCNEEFITILFFYSNSGKLQDISEDVGYILGTFKREDPTRIMIYSFDSDLDSETILKLKEKYEIENVPIVVVNEKEKFFVKNIADLEVYL